MCVGHGATRVAVKTGHQSCVCSTAIKRSSRAAGATTIIKSTSLLDGFLAVFGIGNVLQVAQEASGYRLDQIRSDNSLRSPADL